MDQITFTQGPDVAPAILEVPGGKTVLLGSSVTNLLRVTGSPLNYQWYQDSQPIPGQTNYTLWLTNMQLSQSGIYKLVVSNSLGTATSSNFTYTVVSPQRITSVGQILLPTNEIATAISTSPGPTNAPDSYTVVVTTKNTPFEFPYGYVHILSYDARSNAFTELFAMDGQRLAAALPSSVCVGTGVGTNAGFDVIVIAPTARVLPTWVTLPRPPASRRRTVTCLLHHSSPRPEAMIVWWRFSCRPISCRPPT